MEKLFLYLENEVLKARKVEPFEELKNPKMWKDLQFEYTPSPLMMINWPILLPELSSLTARSLLDLVGARYPFSPNYKKLKSLCPELIFSRDQTQEWVFFGGSFNPWHKGHQACLNLLPEDKICFILPDRNPLKELKELEPVFTVIELVKKIKFGKNHFLAPTFLLDLQKNPTITWVERLHQDFPEKQVSLLIGFDSFKSILDWIRGHELLNMLHALYVVSRLESDQERQEAIKPIKEIAPHLQIHLLGSHEFEGVSSTELRKN